ncbi:hypothetical protein [Croceivirga thetidis]|uniref:Outer membrane protein beta-barrel domain-containing protein n=1 Tax=Croceivirga thetidis TaxID=2721623 RepID=A0ABX1GMJ8_9FLAO|nr:hypothetical protein [Croceivirga thetidis]NKI31145.1 hypothetical protein [Croceivirga thetidis]
MDQNNLDKLFQKKLEDFSPTPDEQVWGRIEASLNKKQKKRVIPIWWGVGTAAAILIFAVLLFNPFEVDENLNQNPVTNTEVNSQKQEDEVELPTNEVNPASVNDISDELVETEKDSQIEESTKDSENQNTPLAPSNQFLTTNKNDGLASSEVGAEQQVEERQKEQGKKEHSPELNFEKPTDDLMSDNAVAVQENQKQQAKFQESKTEEAITDSDEKSEKKSIYEAIEEQLKNSDETEVAEIIPGKWSISPSVAPVYFNAIGQGSPIHSNFSENGKAGKVNLSYGVAVGYEVGKRLKIRSGVHRVNMGYGTEDIQFSSSVEGSTNAMIDNIDYNSTSRSLVVQSRKSSGTESLSDGPTANAELAANTNPALNGSMVQQLGYFEVPMELNYALVDKKFGVNLIGGISSLFLVDNSVSLESQDGLITEMGEANNVNSVNFSTNVGFGLNYQFTDKIQLNVEPIFKYQLNTFTESAGNFNPYSVGVYSGLSFKF